MIKLGAYLGKKGVPRQNIEPDISSVSVQMLQPLSNKAGTTQLGITSSHSLPCFWCILDAGILGRDFELNWDLVGAGGLWD